MYIQGHPGPAGGDMRTRISKWGNSLGIRIPRVFAREAGLEDGDEVEISVSGGRIILTPVMKDYALEDLVSGITAENRHTESDWGKPAGSEGW